MKKNGSDVDGTDSDTGRTCMVGLGVTSEEKSRMWLFRGYTRSFPGWLLSRMVFFPERRFPSGHFPG